MALTIKLAENVAAAHEDKLTLKVISESPVSIERTPLIIPLPGGTVTVLDMGRMQKRIVLTGVVDEVVNQVFIDTVAGTITVGDTMTGTAGWNATVTPPRGATPVCTVAAIAADNSFVIVTGLSASEFFVDNEPVTFVGGVGATALVNEPLPTKQRLEQVARYFYASGVMTLTSNSGTYLVQIKSLTFETEAAKRERYEFRMELVVTDNT